MWRMDPLGWYQLLRRFRKGDLDTRNITSLSMHPERTRGQLLVLAQPAILRIYNLSTYRAQTSYPGLNIGCSFGRALFSADGRFVLSGSEDSRFGISATNPSDDNVANPGNMSGFAKAKPSRIRVWDTSTGTPVNCSLSEITLPYPVRSMSWHPSQHMVAVAMAGHGASVAVYCAEKVCRSCRNLCLLCFQYERIVHYSEFLFCFSPLLTIPWTFLFPY